MKVGIANENRIYVADKVYYYPKKDVPQVFVIDANPKIDIRIIEKLRKFDYNFENDMPLLIIEVQKFLKPLNMKIEKVNATKEDYKDIELFYKVHKNVKKYLSLKKLLKVTEG